MQIEEIKRSILVSDKLSSKPKLRSQMILACEELEQAVVNLKIKTAAMKKDPSLDIRQETLETAKKRVVLLELARDSGILIDNTSSDRTVAKDLEKLLKKRNPSEQEINKFRDELIKQKSIDDMTMGGMTEIIRVLNADKPPYNGYDMKDKLIILNSGHLDIAFDLARLSAKEMIKEIQSPALLDLMLQWDEKTKGKYLTDSRPFMADGSAIRRINDGFKALFEDVQGQSNKGVSLANVIEGSRAYEGFKNALRDLCPNFKLSPDSLREGLVQVIKEHKKQQERLDVLPDLLQKELAKECPPIKLKVDDKLKFYELNAFLQRLPLMGGRSAIGEQKIEKKEMKLWLAELMPRLKAVGINLDQDRVERMILDFRNAPPRQAPLAAEETEIRPSLSQSSRSRVVSDPDRVSSRASSPTPDSPLPYDDSQKDREIYRNPSRVSSSAARRTIMDSSMFEPPSEDDKSVKPKK